VKVNYCPKAPDLICLGPVSKRAAKSSGGRRPSSGGKTRADDAEAKDRLISQRILVLANVLRRGAGLRYRRLLNLRAGEWGVVAELGHQAPRTLNDVARSIGQDKTQLSRTVSALIARGIVQRRTNPRDNREARLSLTALGQKHYAAIMEAGGEAHRTLLADLSPAEQAQLVDLIERLTVRARALLGAEQALSATDDDAD
jgi:DNA-binding MarR family transcriptional regulator